jgi:hypothetical protein
MVDVKRALDLVSKYQDPDSPKMKGWDWRPLRDVQEELGGIPSIPGHVEDFGAFMDEMARKAAGPGLSPRDLIKAYAITRSSIQRRAQDVERLRASGLDLPASATGQIRPEGAMAEWLKSPTGQRYLDAAEIGKVDQDAVAHAQSVMKPFGLNAESQALPWAAQNLSDKHRDVSDMVKRAVSGDSPVAEWREFGKKLHGIGTAKAGFVASMLGRGDQPTLDARQVILQTGMPTSEAKSPMKRAGFEAVDRLAARQTALNPQMDPGLEPFRQHLTHHTIWDKAGNEQTTHSDVVDAMRNANSGGRIGKAGGGAKSQSDIIAHAIAALGIPGHGLSGINPDFVKALQSVSTPFSQDPEVVKRALSVAQGLVPPMTSKKSDSSSYFNVGQAMAPDEVKTKIENIPGVNPLEKKPMSWEDFYRQAKGGTMINVGGDRSNLGRLTHVNGKKLKWPVDLHAGPKYMLEPNPGAVWANSAAHTTSFNNKISEAAKTGPVYGVYSPMSPTAVNSSHNMFDALMAQVDKAKISKADAKEFDDMLRNGMHMEKAERPKGIAAMEKWPGIFNPKEASEFARNLPGTHRSAIVDMMDKSGWMKKGFPSVGITRSAITDPDVMKAPGNMLGHRIVQFDTDRNSVEEKAFKHSTYQEATPGKYVGDVPLVQRQYAMPDVMEQMASRTDWAKPGLIVHPYSDQPSGRSTVRKMFEEQKQSQPVNQRMLDSVMTGLERQKYYGFKAGGAVQPTDAQKEAGNYRKEHITFQGLPISIETRKGEMRSGTGPSGHKWSVKLPYDYGYIKRTEGADGDHVDVCIGPNHQSDRVFIVDQHHHQTGKFDEHKVMLGYRTKSDAEHAYKSGFSDGKGGDRMKSVVELPMSKFKDWLKNGNTKKPAKNIERALSLTSLYSLGHDRDAG